MNVHVSPSANVVHSSSSHGSPAIAELERQIDALDIEAQTYSSEIGSLTHEIHALVDVYRLTLPADECWKKVGTSPAARRQTKLIHKQDDLYAAQNILIEKLCATPVQSLADARVKARVFLKHTASQEGFNAEDEDVADYDVSIAGRILQELAGL